MGAIDADTLRSYCQQLLQAKGVPEVEAWRSADNLVDADLKGVESHGVSRMANYLQRLSVGIVAAKGEHRIIRESPGTALIDACNSMGAEAGTRAMGVAIAKAENVGVSFVTAYNSNHYSAAAYFAQMALEKDMIGFTATNGPARVAPWGGKSPMFGTNPFAIAIPAGRHFPIIVDMATCVVARGKIILAAKKQEPIPLGWARDRDGQDTTDAQAALDGTVLPFGGPKGYAISTVIEVLTGILSGSLFTTAIYDVVSDFDNPNMASHCFGALNIAAFQEPSAFKASIDEFISSVKESPAGAGVDEIFLPGEIELRTKEKRLRDGIPLPEVTLRELRQAGEESGIAFPF